MNCPKCNFPMTEKQLLTSSYWECEHCAADKHGNTKTPEKSVAEQVNELVDVLQKGADEYWMNAAPQTLSSDDLDALMKPGQLTLKQPLLTKTEVQNELFCRYGHFWDEHVGMYEQVWSNGRCIVHYTLHDACDVGQVSGTELGQVATCLGWRLR